MLSIEELIENKDNNRRYYCLCTACRNWKKYTDITIFWALVEALEE